MLSDHLLLMLLVTLFVFRDSRGDLNLAGCYSFLESTLTGQHSCPYVGSSSAKAALWDEDRRSSSSWGYLWPQEEELCHAGVVTYVAREW